MEGRSCNQHKFVEWQFCSGYSLSTSYSPNHWRRDVVVQSLSCVQLFATPWTAACQAPLSFTISWSLLRLKSIESVMSSNHLNLCCPFSSCPQSIQPSRFFPISWFFTSGGQSIGVSASTSVLPSSVKLPTLLPCSSGDQKSGFTWVLYPENDIKVRVRLGSSLEAWGKNPLPNWFRLLSESSSLQP